MHENEGSWGAHARRLELGAAEVDHTWLWQLDPHHGPVMEPDEYVESVRLCLECAGPGEPAPCVACQTGSLDTGAAHATSSGSRPLVSTWGPPGLLSPGLPSFLLCCCRLFSWTGLSPSWLCRPAAVLRDLALSRPTSRSEQLRQLAVQVASLASLEDVVTHGLQFLLEPPTESSPVSAAERALPASLLRRSPTQGCRQSASQLNSAQSARSHWPLPRAASQLRLRARAPPIAAPAPRHLLLVLVSLRAPLARPALSPSPRLVSRLLTPVRPPPCWRWLVRHSKRFMWREIKLQAFA